jgi:hypothetical protein
MVEGVGWGGVEFSVTVTEKPGEMGWEGAGEVVERRRELDGVGEREGGACSVTKQGSDKALLKNK